MDDGRFDAVARAFGGVASRRGALAALAGLAGALGLGQRDGAAKRRRRKRCDPPCPPGQACGEGTCACGNGGTACGTACCLVGQACDAGQCVTIPEPGACVAFGDSCKGTGLPCCDGLQCGSGQGGKTDVACYRPAGAPCSSTAECIYGNACTDGACVVMPQPTPEPTPGCSVAVTGYPDVDGEALRALAESPAGPATITLCAGIYRAEREIAVTRNLEIVAAEPGGEVILDGGWSGAAATDGHRVISVTDAALRLAGVTVRGGYVAFDSSGGGIRAVSTGPETALTLDRVRVTGCNGGFSGGGVEARGDTNGHVTLTVRDSVIAGNVASAGGGLLIDRTTATFSGDTRISGNEANSGSGFWAQSGTVTLGGATIVTGNRANALGAGFYNRTATLACSGTPKVCANPNGSSSGCYTQPGNPDTECGGQLCSATC